MTKVIGHYLVGALWDGSNVYLVDSNRHVFRLEPVGYDSIIFRVAYALSCFDSHVKNFGEFTREEVGRTEYGKDVRIYYLRTHRGSTIFYVRNGTLKLSPFLDAPFDGMRRLADFR